MTNILRAPQIAKQAAAIVAGSRAETHGEKYANHQKIAVMWNGYLAARGYAFFPLTALDVANMMEAMKIARRCLGAHNPDDYIDGAGYAACAGEIAEVMEQERRIQAEHARAAAEDAAREKALLASLRRRKRKAKNRARR